jgi:putative endonuclease
VSETFLFLSVESFIVYILYSKDYNKFYVGQTNNLDRRLDEHNNSEAISYTGKYRPWILHSSIPLKSRSSAVQVESYLKKKPRDFIKRLATDAELVKYIVERFDTG